MKNVVKKPVRGEQGAALILVLVVLLVGGLIAGGLLQHMGAGLLSGEVYARRTDELYAADAGVESAVLKIQQGKVTACHGQPIEPPFYIDVNGKNVEVAIEYVRNVTGSIVYKITSTAVTDDDSNTAAIVTATTVESYVSALYMDFSSLLDNAIVSNSTITIRPGSVVNGDVWLPVADEEHLIDQGTINGTVRDSDNMTIIWPTYEQLSAYYYEDVENTYDPGSSIDVEYTKNIGPCYRDGNLVIDNTGDPDALVLDGTVYVNGDLDFQQSGSHEYTLHLDGHTIFVEGSIDFPSDHVSISGSGCIIAVGNINFQPSIASEGDDFVFVFSITGEIWFHPSGDFTGCVAGNVHVELSPNNEIYWIDPDGKGLDLPWGLGDDDKLPPVTEIGIKSWEVTQQ